MQITLSTKHYLCARDVVCRQLAKHIGSAEESPQKRMTFEQAANANESNELDCT